VSKLKDFLIEIKTKQARQQFPSEKDFDTIQNGLTSLQPFIEKYMIKLLPSDSTKPTFLKDTKKSFNSLQGYIIICKNIIKASKRLQDARAVRDQLVQKNVKNTDLLFTNALELVNAVIAVDSNIYTSDQFFTKIKTVTQELTILTSNINFPLKTEEQVAALLDSPIELEAIFNLIHFYNLQTDILHSNSLASVYCSSALQLLYNNTKATSKNGPLFKNILISKIDAIQSFLNALQTLSRIYSMAEIPENLYVQSLFSSIFYQLFPDKGITDLNNSLTLLTIIDNLMENLNTLKGLLNEYSSTNEFVTSGDFSLLLSFVIGFQCNEITNNCIYLIENILNQLTIPIVKDSMPSVVYSNFIKIKVYNEIKNKAANLFDEETEILPDRQEELYVTIANTVINNTRIPTSPTTKTLIYPVILDNLKKLFLSFSKSITILDFNQTQDFLFHIVNISQRAFTQNEQTEAYLTKIIQNSQGSEILLEDALINLRQANPTGFTLLVNAIQSMFVGNNGFPK
jgi:hypothetical protein